MKMIGKIYNFILDGLGVICGVLIIAVAIGVALDVTLRWAFTKPIGWMVEFSEYSMVCITFLGMGWLARKKGHIVVDLVIDLVPKQIAAAMGRFSAAISVIIGVYLAYWAIVGAIDDFRRGAETFGVYPIPRFPFFLLGAAGLLLTAIEFARQFVLSFTRPDQADTDLAEKIQTKDPL